MVGADLHAVEVVGVADGGQVAKHPGHVGAVDAEVRGGVGVAVGEARGGGRAAQAVGVVAVDGAVHLVVVGFGEGGGLGARVHGGLVDAAELDVGGDAGGDVEGVEGEVAGGVVGEEVGRDDGVGVLRGDAQAGLDDLRFGGEVAGAGVGAEGGAIVGGVAEDDGDVGGGGVGGGDDELFGVDIGAVLDDVAGDGGEVD